VAAAARSVGVKTIQAERQAATPLRSTAVYRFMREKPIPRKKFN
jgi:hypothetical protein